MKLAALVLVLSPYAVQAWRGHVRPLRARTRGRGVCYASLQGASVADVELAQSILLGLSLQLPDSVSGALGSLGDSFQGALESVPSLEGAQDSVKGLLDSIPSPDAVVPDSVKQFSSQITEALPQASDKVQGLLEQFKGALSSVEEALDSNKLTSGVQDQVAGLSEQVKGQLGELQGQLGDVVKGGLGELSSKLGEETSKALQPYQPLIQDLTGDLSVQLGSLKQATDNLLNAVTEDEQIILTTVSPALRIARSVGTPRNLFNYENLITFFLWGSLILTPDSAAVKKLFRGYTVIVVAALAYAWLAYLCFEDPVAMQGFSSMSDLGGLTKGFASQTAVATVWAHLIAGDLFVGRWIYLDGLKNAIFTRHSLFLAFFFGPVGVLSHLFTRGLVKVVRWDVTDIMESGYERVPPSAAEGQAQATLKEADKALKKAERRAEDLVGKAERERERLVGRAQKEANALVAQAKEEAEAILNQAMGDSEKLVAKGRAEGRRILETAQEKVKKTSVAPSVASPAVELPPHSEEVGPSAAPQQ